MFKKWKFNLKKLEEIRKQSRRIPEDNIFI